MEIYLLSLGKFLITCACEYHRIVEWFGMAGTLEII